MAERFYSEEEAQEILRLATHRVSGEGGMTRDRLIQAAAEMGIDPSDVIAAEEEVLAKQERVQMRARYVEAARKEFFGSFSSLVGTSILLFGINYLTSGFHNLWTTWAIWPCGFMALNTLNEGWEWLIAKTPLEDHDFEKWRRKQEKKAVAAAAPAHDFVIHEARKAWAEYGPDQKLAAIKRLRETTGLGLKEAKDAIDFVQIEPALPNRNEMPGARGSAYQIAQQAIQEVGTSRWREAVDLVRVRAGLAQREAQEAVEAVLELAN